MFVFQLNFPSFLFSQVCWNFLTSNPSIIPKLNKTLRRPPKTVRIEDIKTIRKLQYVQFVHHHHLYKYVINLVKNLQIKSMVIEHVVSLTKCEPCTSLYTVQVFSVQLYTLQLYTVQLYTVHCTTVHCTSVLYVYGKASSFIQICYKTCEKLTT